MHKKFFFWFVFFVMFIFLIILSHLTLESLFLKDSISKCTDTIIKFSEYNDNTIFSVNKIVLFSNANGDATLNPNSSFSVSNLHQYTDIAIFINNYGENGFTAKNTLKSVSLSDLKFDLAPSVGSANLYYKNINDFTTNTYDSNNIITKSLDFSTSSEDSIDYSKPILFNNCANPITLSYVNSNIKPNYTLPAGTTNISYDGNLLKDCNITLNSIACKFSFLITIINNLDETYTCTINLDIPLSTENSTIYDGSLLVNSKTDYNFIRIK